MNYYDILGVSKGADSSELKSAYKKASMQHHPDRGGDAEKFKEINQAYSTLKDPQKRQDYDNPRQSQMNFNTQNMGGMPPGFEDLFSNFGFRQQQRNPDVNINCSISLEESFNGKNVLATYQLRNGQEETVDIKIPPGANSGNTICFQGFGESIVNGPRGNLNVRVQVRQHPIFNRQDNHLIMKHTVSVLDLMLGCQDNINTLSGGKILLTIPRGTRPGATFNVTGHGMPDVHNGRRGNLHVVIDATVPNVQDPIDLLKLKEIKDKLVK